MARQQDDLVGKHGGSAFRDTASFPGTRIQMCVLGFRLLGEGDILRFLIRVQENEEAATISDTIGAFYQRHGSSVTRARVRGERQCPKR